MARLAEKSIVIEGAYDHGWREREDRLLREAVEKARAASPGKWVGRILKWGRGDGYAQYMVVCEKPFTLAHIRVGDAYQVEHELIRGLGIGDAQRMVEIEKKPNLLFARR